MNEIFVMYFYAFYVYFFVNLRIPDFIETFDVLTKNFSHIL